jgi:hypothetical protein
MIRNKNTLIFVLAFIGLSVFSQLPIWMVRFPPLVDYPNHLARMYIVSNIQNSEILQEFYSIQWNMIPNLVMDTIVPLLAKVMSVEISGKVFISLIFFLISSGTLALHYTIHRQISFLPLLAFMFLYNRLFLWGFLNYLFGIGIALWGLAAWIYFENKSSLVKASVFSIISLSVFFCHLFSFGIYALCILGYEFYRYSEKRMRHAASEWLITLQQFILPSILLFFFSPTAASGEAHRIVFEVNVIADFLRKISSLIHPLLNYNIILDMVTSCILIILLLWGKFTKTIHFSKQIRYSLALLCAVFLLMPNFIFGSYKTDVRIPIAASFFVVSAIDISIRDRKVKLLLTGILLIIFSVRMGVIIYHWQKADKQYAQYIEAFHKMEEGRCLFAAIGYPDSSWKPFPVPTTHFPCIAVIEKSAFVPSLFAYPNQQPLVLKPRYDELAKKTPGARLLLKSRYGKKMPETNFEFGDTINWKEITDHYDYALISNEQYRIQKVPSSFTEVYKGERFRMFRIGHND